MQFRRSITSVRVWLTLGGNIRAVQPWALLPGPLLLVLALAAPYRWLFFLAYAYLIVSVAAYWWVRRVGPRLRLHRSLRSAWAQVGDRLEEEWELANHSRLPALWLEIDDASTVPGYSGRRVASAEGGERRGWITSAVCVQRGIYSLGPLQARTADPLGLFSYEWHQGGTRQIVVYPPLARLANVHLPWGQRGGTARAELLQQHATPSVGGLREYVPGDLPSHIHWPTVAHTGRLMVKEFDQERAGALWIALDLWAGAYQDARPPSTSGAPGVQGHARGTLQSSVMRETFTIQPWDTPLELAVVIAASLAAQALSDGRLVGLLADDGRRRLVHPGRGPRQLWRILEELVDARAAGAFPLSEVIRQGRASRVVVSDGAALAVVTPALDGAWLAALAEWQRGRPGAAMALLIVATPSSAGALEARLATIGAASYTFTVGQALPLLNPPRPQATARVSPLGRVIMGA